MKVNYFDWIGEIPNKINIHHDGIKQVYFQCANGYWIEINCSGQKKMLTLAIDCDYSYLIQLGRHFRSSCEQIFVIRSSFYD